MVVKESVIRAALEYLKLIRNNPGMLAHYSKSRPLSEYLAEYCQAHLDVSRSVALSAATVTGKPNKFERLAGLADGGYA